MISIEIKNKHRETLIVDTYDNNVTGSWMILIFTVVIFGLLLWAIDTNYKSLAMMMVIFLFISRMIIMLSLTIKRPLWLLILILIFLALLIVTLITLI